MSSQVDSLLDLGDLSSTPAVTMTTTDDSLSSSMTVSGGDPFDPFAMSSLSSVNSAPTKQTSADPFDPFCQIPSSSSATNGNLDPLDNDFSINTQSQDLVITATSTSSADAGDNAPNNQDVTNSDLLGDYLLTSDNLTSDNLNSESLTLGNLTSDNPRQDYLFSDSLISPSNATPANEMSVSSLTDITPPKAYLDDDLLNSPMDGPTSNGGDSVVIDPFLQLNKADGDTEVTQITESSTDDGSFQITTVVADGGKLSGQEAQFDDLLDDLNSSSPPPISSEPPEEEEEELSRELSVTSPHSLDGSTNSDRAKSPVDHLYESLPDVQMPKRYTKPDEKETKNAPKVLIMSEYEEITTETTESPSGEDGSDYITTTPPGDKESDYFTTTEYEMEPSQPFGSLLSTWVSSTENATVGLPSEKVPVQSYLKTKEQTSKNNAVTDENMEPVEVIRAEDKVEDDLENLPSIGNLRSRFEVKDKTPPPREEKKPAKLRQNWASPTAAQEVDAMESSRVNGVHQEGEDEIAREIRKREEVGADGAEEEDIHFGEMNNIRSRFEQVAKEQTAPPPLPTHNLRSPSKWEKPKPQAVDVVNRQEGDDSEDEERDGLPPAEQTREILNRFRQMEMSADQEVVPERKPVRKITPPRQDMDVTRASDQEESPERDPAVIRHDDPNPEEEAMPPPAITKNLLAKFKSMEKTDEQPPSPSLSALKQKAALSKPRYTSNVRAPVVYDNVSASSGGDHTDNEDVVSTGSVEPAVQAVEHGVFENTPDVRPEVLRETHVHEEEELPPVGATKSLLAQWKSMETVADVKDVSMTPTGVTTPRRRGTGASLSKTSPGRDSNVSKSNESLDSRDRHHSVNSDLEAGEQNVARETDGADDKEAIPPAFTRNLVAKFQQLSDSDRENTPPPSKKKQTPAGSQKKNSRSLSTNDIPRKDTQTPVTQKQPQRKWSQTQQYVNNNSQPEPEIEEEIETEVQQSSESKPEVVKSDDPAETEDELPPPAFTKNLLARFRSMEDLNRPAPTPELDLAVKKSLALEKKKELDPNRRKSSPAGMFAKLTPHKIDFEETADQYTERQQPEGGEYANGHAEVVTQYADEELDSDIDDMVRESDAQLEEELPEVGTTQNLLAKFQSMMQS